MRFHTNLPVHDIERTIAFYRVLFDTEPVKVKSDYAKFLPPGLDLNISFHQSANGPGHLADLHLGVELPDQAAVDQAHRRLADAGLITIERETAICCYANQDKFWVSDPNGYAWELYTLLEDTEQKIEPSSCCAPEPAAAGVVDDRAAKTDSASCCG